MSAAPGSLADYIEHFSARVLQDALAEASADYWLRRAKCFDAVGTDKADEIATACRNRARVSMIGGDVW